MSDHNISEFMQKNQTDASVDIDESWALKLLNECEAEDAAITVNTVGQLHNGFSSRHHLKMVEDTDMHSERLLSAIECQKLAFEEKQQAKLEAELAGKNRLSSSFSRLKSFFA